MPYHDKISKLFLDLENAVGTSKLNDKILRALCRSIHDFKEQGEEDFFKQFYELFELVKNTQPRIALVIDNFYDIWESLLAAKEKDHPEGHLYWERQVLKTIQKSRQGIRKERTKIIAAGAKEIKNGDVILIHGISGTVLDTLRKGKQLKRKFRVIVAEQETEKTLQMIEILSQYNIEFQVVPEYMLSHIEMEITKVFLGAVTINSEMTVVSETGTNAIVSEFHLLNTPIYLFVSTRKFSLWKARASHHTYKVKNTRVHDAHKPICFERIKFSHDRVPLDLYDRFITEMGVLDGKEIRNLYQRKFHQREWWRKEFFAEKE